MDKFSFTTYFDPDVLQQWIASLVLIASLLTFRFFFYRIIRNLQSQNRDTQRWLMVHLRNGLFFAFLLGLIVIWATQLRSMALSVAAVAAAAVLAARDVLSCVAGTFVKTLSQSFSIGDRIEIDGIRGDVIDHTFLNTTLLEIGPGHLTHGYTGRAITIPNGLFLLRSLINESYTDHYVLHVFEVPLSKELDWEKAEKILLEAARDVCAPFAELAKMHFEQLGRRRGLDTPTTEPRTTLSLKAGGVMEVIVRICVPARQKGKAEQAVLRRFLERSSK